MSVARWSSPHPVKQKATFQFSGRTVFLKCMQVLTFSQLVRVDFAQCCKAHQRCLSSPIIERSQRGTNITLSETIEISAGSLHVSRPKNSQSAWSHWVLACSVGFSWCFEWGLRESWALGHRATSCLRLCHKCLCYCVSLKMSRGSVVPDRASYLFLKKFWSIDWVSDNWRLAIGLSCDCKTSVVSVWPVIPLLLSGFDLDELSASHISGFAKLLTPVVDFWQGV